MQHGSTGWAARWRPGATARNRFNHNRWPQPLRSPQLCSCMSLGRSETLRYRQCSEAEMRGLEELPSHSVDRMRKWQGCLRVFFWSGRTYADPSLSCRFPHFPRMQLLQCKYAWPQVRSCKCSIRAVLLTYSGGHAETYLVASQLEPIA